MELRDKEIKGKGKELIMNEKDTKKRREWVKNAAIIFLTIMLLLTFFSNTIMNYSLPEVATQYVQKGTITAKVRGTGNVEATDPYNVIVKETRVISAVAVKQGDTVEKDQIIYYLEDAESDELKKAEDELEELGIKIKRLESMTSTGTQTDVHGKTQLKDTVFVHKTDTVTIKENGKYFKWGDTWNTISGKIIGDNVECSYHGTDTLTVVAHRVPKKFLFIKWGTKYIEGDIVNKNSSTVITYNKTIKIKR